MQKLLMDRLSAPGLAMDCFDLCENDMASRAKRIDVSPLNDWLTAPEREPANINPSVEETIREANFGQPVQA